jgi:hypothetical protein
MSIGEPLYVECEWCGRQLPTIQLALAHIRTRHPREVRVWLIDALTIVRASTAIEISSAATPGRAPSASRRRQGTGKTRS